MSSHKSRRDEEHDPGADRYYDGPPVDNVSGSVKVVGSTVRQNRDPGGRFRSRRPTLIRGLDKPGADRGSNAVLHRDPTLGPFDVDLVHYASPDYSAAVPHDRKSHDRNRGNQEFINHVLDCPSCAADGFVKVSGGIPTVFGPEEVG